MAYQLGRDARFREMVLGFADPDQFIQLCLYRGAVLELGSTGRANIAQERRALTPMELGGHRRIVVGRVYTVQEGGMVDKDRVKGSATRIKGKVKEVIGKATGDPKLEGEAKPDKEKG